MLSRIRRVEETYDGSTPSKPDDTCFLNEVRPYCTEQSDDHPYEPPSEMRSLLGVSYAISTGLPRIEHILRRT